MVMLGRNRDQEKELEVVKDLAIVEVEVNRNM